MKKTINSFQQKVETATGEKTNQTLQKEMILRLSFGKLVLFPTPLLHNNYLKMCEGELREEEYPNVSRKKKNKCSHWLCNLENAHVYTTKKESNKLHIKRYKKPLCYVLKKKSIRNTLRNSFKKSPKEYLRKAKEYIKPKNFYNIIKDVKQFIEPEPKSSKKVGTNEVGTNEVDITTDTTTSPKVIEDLHATLKELIDEINRKLKIRHLQRLIIKTNKVLKYRHLQRLIKNTNLILNYRVLQRYINLVNSKLKIRHVVKNLQTFITTSNQVNIKNVIVELINLLQNIDSPKLKNIIIFLKELETKSNDQKFKKKIDNFRKILQSINIEYN